MHIAPAAYAVNPLPMLNERSPATNRTLFPRLRFHLLRSFHPRVITRHVMHIQALLIPPVVAPVLDKDDVSIAHILRGVHRQLRPFQRVLYKIRL